MHELDVARRAAEEAGQILKRYFSEGFSVSGKESQGLEAHNLVTEADLAAEHAIAAVIRSAFPDHSILGEEAHQGDLSAEHLWIVDPLDGTTNFAHLIPHFAVSIAYLHRGRAMCGVIYNPIREDWYDAVRGGGARRNGQRVHVSDATDLNQVLIGIGFYYDRGAMMEATLTAIRDLFRAQIHGVRRFGTASLDLCQVGCGMFGAFFEYHLAAWDFAAGGLFVEEAGGQISDCRGQDLPIGPTSVLASNGKLHAAMLQRVQPPYESLGISRRPG